MKYLFLSLLITFIGIDMLVSSEMEKSKQLDSMNVKQKSFLSQ